jgi:branched-chain amino acid transport system permease protein
MTEHAETTLPTSQELRSDADAVRVVLSVRDLTKSFGELKAVANASFDVRAGEVTSLVGPNGAGKTTVFNLVAGALRADSGSVTYEGTELLGQPVHARAGLGIGRTFQDSRLILELASWENVAVGFQAQTGETLRSLMLHPIKSARFRARLRASALEVLGQYDMEHLADIAPQHLSYGERKLISLAQAEATGARLLLLDEPTSGLDRPTLDRLLRRLQTLVQDGRTVLLVEHNMQLVRQFSDQMVFLHHGAVVAEGRPVDLMGRGDLRDLYFGVAA